MEQRNLWLPIMVVKYEHPVLSENVAPTPIWVTPKVLSQLSLMYFLSTEWIDVCSCCKKMYRAWTETSNFIIVQNDGKFCPSCSMQALARKIKLLTFYRNWEIRKVFTKGRQHDWRQNFFFGATHRTLENPIHGKEMFQGMTLHNTHKSPLRNVFFPLLLINLVGIWNGNK